MEAVSAIAMRQLMSLSLPLTPASHPTSVLVGLVWNMEGGSISNSYATGDASSYFKTNCSDVGGLVGNMEGGSISNSYATGDVFSPSPILHPGWRAVSIAILRWRHRRASGADVVVRQYQQ